MTEWERFVQQGASVLLKHVITAMREPMDWTFRCTQADGSFVIEASYRHGDKVIKRKDTFSSNLLDDAINHRGDMDTFRHKVKEFAKRAEELLEAEQG